MPALRPIGGRGGADLNMPADVEWYRTTNRDKGSLKTGAIQVEVGETIEIRGEGKLRRVTYVMGPAGNWHACFKGQGAVPEGELEWRVVSLGKEVTPAPPSHAPTVPLTPGRISSLQATTYKAETRLHMLKLVLEIIGVAIAIIGGIVALVW